MRAVAATLILSCVLIPGCTYRGIDKRVRNKQWVLVKMEIDRAQLGNRGGLPLFNSPGSDPGASIPRAQGSMRVNDRGKVTCFVSIYEPTIGLGGTIQTLKYDIVKFFGYSTDDSTLFVMEDSVAADVALGRATVLHVRELAEGRLRVQPATGARLLPYIYFFEPGPVRSTPIHVPYVDA